MRLIGAAHSDVGRVRSVNQDAALADDARALFAVADGMGGHKGGEVASALALDALVSGLGLAAPRSAEALVDAVIEANDKVLDEAHDDPELAGMGTTLCAVALVGSGSGTERLGLVNVGDSRIYVLDDGGLTQLTEDHSLVADMVRAGQLSPGEAAVHPQRNILTRALGVEAELAVDWWERPAVPGERYLLCSDGLFNEVPEPRIAATLRQLADPAAAARELVQLANTGGGRDNITCIVVDVVGDDGPPPAEDPGPTAARRLEERLDAERPVAPADTRPRRFTLRLVLFLAALAAVAGGAYVAVRMWAGNSYFVGVGPDGDVVTIFQGRPGGFLWFDPSPTETVPLRASELIGADQQKVQDRYQTTSLTDARRWASELRVATTTTTTPEVPTPPTGTPTTPNPNAGPGPGTLATTPAVPRFPPPTAAVVPAGVSGGGGGPAPGGGPPPVPLTATPTPGTTVPSGGAEAGGG